jgi:molybdenum cofactor cytidylyltransferase/nicotine blue oxidoreductase
MSNVAGAVLAAGAGSRMGRPKATLVVDGARLLDRAVEALRTAGCAPIHAVVRDGMDVAGAEVIVNPDAERGQRSSLELVVAAARGCDALAVVLVDVPGLTADAIRTVVAAWRPGRIAVAAARGRRAHPIVMSPVLWREAVTLAGPDEGARGLLRARPDLVDEIAVEDDPTDVDTPADLADWLSRNRANPA